MQETSIHLARPPLRTFSACRPGQTGTAVARASQVFFAVAACSRAAADGTRRAWMAGDIVTQLKRAEATMTGEASKQFSFRLPETLVERVDECTHHMRDTGLDVSRADVVRLLLTHALDATRCQIERLLRAPKATRKRKRK
jgi:hypothetical protein